MQLSGFPIRGCGVRQGLMKHVFVLYRDGRGGMEGVMANETTLLLLPCSEGPSTSNYPSLFSPALTTLSPRPKSKRPLPAQWWQLRVGMLVSASSRGHLDAEGCRCKPEIAEEFLSSQPR